MRVGLDARVVIHHSQTRVMRSHAMPTAAWKVATAVPRWVAARIESRRKGPGPQAGDA
jgi:hypothetical protein